MPKIESTLHFPELWPLEEEEDVISLLVMGAKEPSVAEDPTVKMEDISGDLYQEGQQIKIASPEAVEERESNQRQLPLRKSLQIEARMGKRKSRIASPRSILLFSWRPVVHLFRMSLLPRRTSSASPLCQVVVC